MTQRVLHMIGNAHIDPVWLWQWPEGYQEVRATFRSALDRLQVIDAFTAHGVNRARHVTSHPGGKGLIVARAVRRLGHPVTLYGFLGGAIGDLIANECRQLGIDDRHVRIAGETRISPIMVENLVIAILFEKYRHAPYQRTRPMVQRNPRQHAITGVRSRLATLNGS